MKKLLSSLLAFTLVLSLTACGTTKTPAASPTSPTAPADTSSGGSAPVSTELKKYKVGVLEVLNNEETVIRRDYYENYLGPKYNVEFMFSEAIKGTEPAMRFVENSADAGCDGIISFYYNDAAQLSQLCDNYDMKYIVNSNRAPSVEEAFTGGSKSFAGSFGADVESVGKVFDGWMRKHTSKDGSEGFLLMSSIAYTGGAQQIEIVTAVLNVLKELYGLNYEGDIAKLITTATPIEVKNDKNINIYIYPGMPTDEGWMQGFSTVLQTGKYRTMINLAGYASTTVVVDEAEQSIKQDLMVAGNGAMSTTLVDTFHTKDSFGNPSINMATIRSASMMSGMAFAKIYNAMSGFEACNLDANKEPSVVRFQMWPIETPEMVDVAKEWDTVGGNKWVCDYSILDQMLGINNPELTSAGIDKVIDDVTLESIVKRFS